MVKELPGAWKPGKARYNMASEEVVGKVQTASGIFMMLGDLKSEGNENWVGSTNLWSEGGGTSRDAGIPLGAGCLG